MAPRCITFTVDLPPKELSPNMTRNVHWHVKNDAVNQYKAQVSAVCRQAMGPQGLAFSRARISLVFGLRDRRPKELKRVDRRYHPEDFDNAIGSIKALIDGVVVAGLVPDDSWKHLECGSVRPDFGDGPWVLVTIEEIPS